MSDYMAQKADEQIEAGLSYREELIAEVETLRATNQVMKEALIFYKNHADCKRSTGIAPCKCSFCKGDDQHRTALTRVAEMEKKE